jgi:hypothetical protein
MKNGTESKKQEIESALALKAHGAATVLAEKERCPPSSKQRARHCTVLINGAIVQVADDALADRNAEALALGGQMSVGTEGKQVHSDKSVH